MIWDSTNWTVLKIVITGHKNWVLCIAWSPDGKHLVSGDKTGHVYMWDPQNGKTDGSAFNVRTSLMSFSSWKLFEYLWKHSQIWLLMLCAKQCIACDNLISVIGAHLKIDQQILQESLLGSKVHECQKFLVYLVYGEDLHYIFFCQLRRG